MMKCSRSPPLPRSSNGGVPGRVTTTNASNRTLDNVFWGRKKLFLVKRDCNVLPVPTGDRAGPFRIEKAWSLTVSRNEPWSGTAIIWELLTLLMPSRCGCIFLLRIRHHLISRDRIANSMAMADILSLASTSRTVSAGISFASSSSIPCQAISGLPHQPIRCTCHTVAINIAVAYSLVPNACRLYGAQMTTEYGGEITCLKAVRPLPLHVHSNMVELAFSHCV